MRMTKADIAAINKSMARDRAVAEKKQRDTALTKAQALRDGSGGSFAAALADAYTLADSVNAHRLIAAFPHLFAETGIDV